MRVTLRFHKGCCRQVEANPSNQLVDWPGPPAQTQTDQLSIQESKRVEELASNRASSQPTRPIKPPTKPPINKTNNQPIFQTTKRPTGRQFSQPVPRQPTNQPTIQPAGTSQPTAPGSSGSSRGYCHDRGSPRHADGGGSGS